MKTKKLKNILGLGILFIASASFLFFGNAEKSYAAALDCSAYTATDIGACNYDTGNQQNVSCQKCVDICGGANNCPGMSRPCDKCGWIKFKAGTSSVLGVRPSSDIEGRVTIKDAPDPDNIVSKAFRWLLSGILSLVGMLLSAAGTIFGWIIDVNNFKRVVDGPVIYKIWQQVRDVLNIAFILVLLYSAFCTILQIEKYSYKKLLLNLVIMALLVNFSFPITRFIIDTSNVLMYTIADTLLGAKAGDALGSISDNSGIGAILTPGGEAPISFLIAAIVFGFILAITLLAVGILLVVRMIALALLIIFSPLAFVATILPDASGYSSKWWDNLFKYSFFGPIMLFVIYIASAIAGEMSKSTPDFVAIAQSNTISPQMIGFMAYFAMPIVLLWMGMGIAQSMSIAGAGAVMGGAQKLIKGAGKKFSGFNAIKKQYTDYKKERDARKEEARWKPGKKLGEKANDVQDSIYAQLGSTKAQKRLDKRRTEKNNKDINDGAEELIKGGATGETIINGAGVNFGKATDKPGKVNDAKQARAYMKMDFNDRRNGVEDKVKDILSGGSSAEVNNVINIDAADIGLTGAAAARHATDQAAASSLIVEASMRNLTPDEINQINRFINSQMAAAVRKGSTAS